MSPTFQHLAPRDETTTLQERVNRLRASLEWAGEAIAPELRAELAHTVTRCDERLALGVDHTIVALAGGTGSGKSSLFNVLVEQDFAVPGVARPTTSHMSSAAWGEGAGALLDWLGVEEERRLAIDAGSGADAGFSGMVLLDLPDHDSVNGANRDVVDRVVPMADLLLWVVDPQKYADHALHSAYLRVASDYGQPSLVLLNHIDRLSTEDGWAVATDLQQLLAEDGLTHVGVIPVSAVTGEGVDVWREELRSATRARTVAAEAVRADLVAAGRMLAGALAREAEPHLPEVDEMVHALARAVGVDARADAAAAVAAGRATQIPALGEVTLAAVERERLDWVDAATVGLPREWNAVVGEAVASARVLTEDINAALRAIEWPEVEHGHGMWARLTRRSRTLTAQRVVLAVGREVVRRVLVPSVVEPTARIHEAYRVLDELTELD